jgi:hypothetical protein
MTPQNGENPTAGAVADHEWNVLWSFFFVEANRQQQNKSHCHVVHLTGERFASLLMPIA